MVLFPSQWNVQKKLRSRDTFSSLFLTWLCETHSCTLLSYCSLCRRSVSDTSWYVALHCPNAFVFANVCVRVSDVPMFTSNKMFGICTRRRDRGWDIEVARFTKYGVQWPYVARSYTAHPFEPCVLCCLALIAVATYHAKQWRCRCSVLVYRLHRGAFPETWFFW